MSSDCDTCLNICEHPKGTWFSKGEIKYCRFQNLWLLSHSDLLDEGIWPIKESGYIDTHENVQVTKTPTNGHQITLEVWSELVQRLAKTKSDGETLRSEASAGLDFNQLSKAARNALNYISGWRQRRQDFKTWLRQHKYRAKVSNHKEG